jgi:hypothetical protein
MNNQGQQIYFAAEGESIEMLKTEKNVNCLMVFSLYINKPVMYCCNPIQRNLFA